MSQLLSSRQRRYLPLCSFVSFVVLITVFGCAGPPKHPSWKNATGGEAHERLMWQAIRDGDWRDFEQHLAPAFVGVDWDGRGYDRAGWVERWKAAAIRDYSLGEITVQPAGPDMVVTYLATLPGAAPDQIRVVSVWQQVKGHWILTASSMTPVHTH
jgi:hypothetical protein